MEPAPPKLLMNEGREQIVTERKVSREEVAAIVARIGVTGADEAFITRVHELNTELMVQLARLPDFGKDVEPAHVFAVPLR